MVKTVTVLAALFLHKRADPQHGRSAAKPSPNRLENIMLVIYLVWEYNLYVSCPQMCTALCGGTHFP